MCDYASETVADVEARKKTARFGPQIKNALLLAVVAFFITRKAQQAAIIAVIYSLLAYIFA